MNINWHLILGVSTFLIGITHLRVFAQESAFSCAQFKENSVGEVSLGFSSDIPSGISQMEFFEYGCGPVERLIIRSNGNVIDLREVTLIFDDGERFDISTLRTSVPSDQGISAPMYGASIRYVSIKAVALSPYRPAGNLEVLVVPQVDTKAADIE